MASKARSGPPWWFFTIVMVGGFVACGVYLGMMHLDGITTGNLLRAVGFGALGFLMLWGVLARR
jgi:hypothetical protein